MKTMTAQSILGRLGVILVVGACLLTTASCRKLTSGRFGANGEVLDGPGGASGGNGQGGGNGLDGGLDANGCRRTTCLAQGASCGVIDDGCGSTIDCSAAPGGSKCGGGTVCDALSHTCIVCIPKTCESEGKTCGNISDGCGGTINCTDTASGGMGCPTGTTCGGGGVPNVCGCRPTNCQELGASCGTVPDGCGAMLDCTMATGGGCAPGQECDTATNQCFFPNCVPLTCADLGDPCGPVSDGCGRTINCSKCPAGTLCDALTNSCVQHPGDGGPSYGLPSAACGERVCGKMQDACGYSHDCGAPTACGGATVCKDNQCTTCTPITTCLPRRCGDVPNGCGSTIQCGNPAQSPPYANVCEPGEVCDQLRNLCVDPQPTTCVEQGKNCGFISDGIGNIIPCGTCTAPETCGGAGTQGVCGLNAANRACLAAQITCGNAEDACGNSFLCGGCDLATQTCTGGQCVQCPPKLTCASPAYNLKCGSALTDGCNGTIDCSANCPNGYQCNTTSGDCEACVDPCLADTGDCTTAASCGATSNNCGTKVRCSTSYNCGSDCTAAPGSPGSLTCINNQCCVRDSLATTCGNGALCGNVTDNCGFTVACTCPGTGNVACTTSGSPQTCVSCPNLCTAQNRECGAPTGVTPDPDCPAASACGTCGGGDACNAAGACCHQCPFYYGQSADPDAGGPLAAQPRCGRQIPLDPGGGGPTCPDGNCTTCPGGDACFCDVTTSPHTCAAADNGEVGYCLSCAEACTAHRNATAQPAFCGALVAFPGCTCGCDILPAPIDDTDQCVSGTCCHQDDAATTCQDSGPTELCGSVTNNCGVAVNCACNAAEPPDNYCADIPTVPDQCLGCCSQCTAQNRECGVPANGVAGQATCAANVCASGTCGGTACPGTSVCANGTCCDTCGSRYPNSDPDAGGPLPSLQRCGVSLPLDPGDPGGGTGPNPVCADNDCTCPGGSFCVCDFSTSPHTCAMPGDDNEVGWCMNCANIVAAYRASIGNPNYCGVVPGYPSCNANCAAGNACIGNTCTPCATACAGRECNSVGNGFGTCNCGTCPGGGVSQCVNGACCATCNYYYNALQCGNPVTREVGQTCASNCAYAAAGVTCGAANLNCTSCPGGNTCSGGICQCIPEAVATTCQGSGGANTICETRNNNCGQPVNCDCTGAPADCTGPGPNAGLCCQNDGVPEPSGGTPDRCCQPNTLATACGGSNSVGDPCGGALASDGCGGNHTCPACIGGGLVCRTSDLTCCLPQTAPGACGGSNSVGDPCGPTAVSDGCNSTVTCGPCVGGTLVCNGGTCCQPGTVASLCGNSDSAGDPCNTTPSNGCGGTVSCGDCSAGPPGLVCNGGTCCNSNCGPNDCGDKTICGVARSCGACGGGQQCNAGLCCAPRTCAVNYPNRCGSLTDNCGGNVSCSCSGLRSCSATNCLCPAPDVGATHPGVVAGGFCTGLCQVQKWIGTDGSSATLRDLGTGASPSPNYVDACKITCNDCGGGGG